MVNLPAVRVTALDRPTGGGGSGTPGPSAPDSGTGKWAHIGRPAIDGYADAEPELLAVLAYTAHGLRSRWTLAAAALAAVLTVAGVDLWEALGITAAVAVSVKGVLLGIEGHRAEAAVRAARAAAARHTAPGTDPDASSLRDRRRLDPATGQVRDSRPVTVEVVDVLPLPRELTASRLIPTADDLTRETARAASA